METLRFAAGLLLELVPLFVLVSTVVYLAVDALTPRRVERLLGSRSSLAGVPLATLLGALTPFCSCSTVPIVNGMLRAGVPTPPLVAFLIASPLVSPVAVALLWGSLGAAYAALYAAAAMALAAVGGLLIGGRESWPGRPRSRDAGSPGDSGAACCGPRPAGEIPDGRDLERASAGPPSWPARLGGAAARSLLDLRRLALPLLAAVAVGALIHGYAPTELLLRLAGPESPWAVPVAALVGVPIYASIVVLLPLGAGLLAQGVGIGAVTAFLMGASGFSIPEGILLSRILPRPLLARTLAVFTAGVIAIGLLFHLLPVQTFPTVRSDHDRQTSRQEPTADSRRLLHARPRGGGAGALPAHVQGAGQPAPLRDSQVPADAPRLHHRQPGRAPADRPVHHLAAPRGPQGGRLDPRHDLGHGDVVLPGRPAGGLVQADRRRGLLTGPAASERRGVNPARWPPRRTGLVLEEDR